MRLHLTLGLGMWFVHDDGLSGLISVEDELSAVVLWQQAWYWTIAVVYVPVISAAKYTS